MNRALGLLLLGLAFQGCASAPGAPIRSPCTPADPAECQALYSEATKQTASPSADRISTSLEPLTRSNRALRWNDPEHPGQVLMVTWARAGTYPKGAYTLAKDDTIWLTPYPFGQRFCRGLGLKGDALNLRIAQNLGLPPVPYGGTSYYQGQAFFHLWVDAATVFRPCPDPEILDSQCQADLTAAGPSPANCPDGCPWQDALDGRQTSGAFASVTAGHLQWMCSTWRQLHCSGPQGGYPWTSLGYTYDWGQTDGLHHGQSEFVVMAPATVEVVGSFETEAYCTSEP